MDRYETEYLNKEEKELIAYSGETCHPFRLKVGHFLIIGNI